MGPASASATEVDVLDEEYLHHVRRGSELLARGEHDSAVLALARARQLRPTDTRVLGLLGQALYRLGRFDEAGDVFQALVDATPAEAAARVNVGLARLKAKQYPEAITQLEVALELQPGHRRALGYLGLALLETGELERARDSFTAAGSDAMVARCDDLLAQARTARAAEAATVAAGSSATPAGRGTTPAPEDAILAAAQLSMVPDAPFTLDHGFVVTRVAGEVLVRSEGLVALHGRVRVSGAQEQHRGHAVDRPFGDRSRRMLRGTGAGAIVHSVPGKRLTRLELDGERSACVCDAVILAFEGSLAYENGRVASRLGTDLEVVQLRGRGQVLLASRGPIALVPVTPASPIRVPVSRVAGWIGALAPHFGPLADQERGPGRADSAPLAIELSGEGDVLLEAEGSA